MNIKNYDAITQDFRQAGDNQARQKRIEYTESRGDEDVLANFKATAKDIDIRPLDVLYTFMKKHWSSLVNYIKTGAVHSESIEGRIMDLIQYLELTHATIIEQTHTPKEIEDMIKSIEMGNMQESLNIETSTDSDVPGDRGQQVIKGNLGDPEC